nr:immunoglobulin light chain junction region [Macaca mulatta]
DYYCCSYAGSGLF